MNSEIKAFLSLQAKVSGAFNFFINGMVAALIYHKADSVPTDSISLAIDLTLTCLLTFLINAPFCWANLKSSKTAGILENSNKFIGFLSRLFRRPVLFGILIGLASSACSFIVIAPVFALLGIKTLPFGIYILVKIIFSLLLGGAATYIELYCGMCKAGDQQKILAQ